MTLLQKKYTTDEITYSLNDDGYRCDSFSNESEFPILFMGCSFTEGKGLPLNEVWSYHLHNKIVNTTNKTIPFWSLGKRGTSIDYAARCFYQYSKQLKPKYIFYLMSGISRREYSYETSELLFWHPGQFPKAYEDKFKTISKIFTDSNFSTYQALRSAMILNSVATITDTKIFIFVLNMDSIDENIKIDLFNQFDKIEYFPVNMSEIYEAVRIHIKNQHNTNLSIPESILSRPIRADDNEHPGALWQYMVYDTIWKIVEKKVFL
jgi:hypothetical protein